MARIVAIVEDDFDQRENYADALKKSGYEVTTYANRREALAGMRSKMPDLAILDIMLEQEMDGGFDLCRDLRALSPTLPIIFLTARDTDIDRVSGLRLDAWDYLTKPLNMQFLSVRINSLFRIVDSLGSGSNDTDNSELLVIGELTIDEDRMSIRWRGQELSLTLTEFWLIESMARHPGHVKTYENMMQITRQSYVERNTINGYIRRIRNKFKEIDPDFKNIQTIFGVGYKWNTGD
ncbi:MAG: response regulator [Gammaproteobacteria bacterium]|nr:response regulator [Gammaproteobacteria bacterium]